MSQSDVTKLLFTIRYKCDDDTHIKVIDNRLCGECATRACTFICPSDVYEWDDDRKLLRISYENCLECGTYRIACTAGNIDWSYMLIGYGIAYRYG